MRRSKQVSQTAGKLPAAGQDSLGLNPCLNTALLQLEATPPQRRHQLQKTQNTNNTDCGFLCDVLFLGKYLAILVSSEGKNIPGPNSGLHGISGPL